MRKQVEIYTDGSCLGNPGPGVTAPFCGIDSTKKLSMKAFA